MSPDPVTRHTEDSEGRSTLAVRTVEIFLHKSPGWSTSDVDRGIASLDFRVTKDGRTIQTGRTGEDGKIDMRVRGGESVLELLWDGNVVASHTVSLGDETWEAANTIRGVQQRLKTLGYPIGHAVPPPPPDTDDDDDDEDDEEPEHEHGIDGVLGLLTDKAIHDFQVDHGLSFDGVVGSGTRNRMNGTLGGSAGGEGGGS